MVLPGISPVFCVSCSSFVFGWFGSSLYFAGGCFPSLCIVFVWFRFSFVVGLFLVLSFLLPLGPPLGDCVLLLGFWLVCPPLFSLAMSPSAAVLGFPYNAPWSSVLGVLSLVFLLCLTFFMFVLSSLLFFWFPSVWGPLLAEVDGL